MCDDLREAVARDPLGCGARLGDRLAVTRPADGARRITCFVEKVDPRLPRIGVQPESVDEDDRSGTCLHRLIFARGDI
jgi:hypothetical protein